MNIQLVLGIEDVDEGVECRPRPGLEARCAHLVLPLNVIIALLHCLEELLVGRGWTHRTRQVLFAFVSVEMVSVICAQTAEVANRVVVDALLLAITFHHRLHLFR